jgi:hypothetical protein
MSDATQPTYCTVCLLKINDTLLFSKSTWAILNIYRFPLFYVDVYHLTHTNIPCAAPGAKSHSSHLTYCSHTDETTSSPAHRCVYIPALPPLPLLKDLLTCKHDGAVATRMMTDYYYRTETNHRHDVNCRLYHIPRGTQKHLPSPESYNPDHDMNTNTTTFTIH